jgi:hypothetical protein
MDDGTKRVGSTFLWLEAYASRGNEKWKDVAFALIVLVLATGSAVLVTVGHEVHVAAAARFAAQG